MSSTDTAVAIIWNTIAKELSDLPDLEQATRVVFKLVLAALLGGLLGFEREASGKSAGLRTHMLVAMGAAMFMTIALLLGVTPAWAFWARARFSNRAKAARKMSKA